MPRLSHRFAVPSMPFSLFRCGLAAASILCTALLGTPGLAAQNRPIEEGPPIFQQTDWPRLAPARVPGLRVKIATPEEGIEGVVREAGTILHFKSRKSGDSLTASIVAADGTVLYEYHEFDGETLW